MTRAKLIVPVVVVVNLVPLVLVAADVLDLHGLLLAYVLETAVGLVLLARAPRPAWWVLAATAVLGVAWVVALVQVVRDVDRSPGNLVVAVVVGSALAAVTRWAREEGSAGIGWGRVAWQMSIVVAGTIAAGAVAGYIALDRAGWTPAVVGSGLRHWWTIAGSTVALAIARATDAVGIPPAAFPAVLLVTAKTFDEGWVASRLQRLSPARS